MKRKSPWNDEELSEERLEEMDTALSGDEKELKKDPIKKFIEQKHKYGKEETSVNRQESRLREYEAFLYHEFKTHVCEASDEHVAEFNNHLKGEYRDKYYIIEKVALDGLKDIDVSSHTRHNHLSLLSEFYGWLEDEGVVSNNPARKALNDFPDSEFDTSSPDRPTIDLESMAEFLEWLPPGFPTVFWLFLLKTGVRRGEAVNVDLCCVNLDHPVYQSYIKKRGIELKPDIKDKEDAVYIRPKFRKGDEVDGEIRQMGNKRMHEKGTVIPIDNELKTALLEWILIRPEARQHPPQSKPLFSKRQTHSKNNRRTHSSLQRTFLRQGDFDGYLERYGWYESGAPTEEKVTFHYTRHYFTHNHKQGQGVDGAIDNHIPDSTMEYLRGDRPSSDSMKDTVYSHSSWNNWNKFVKEPYLENVYQFGLYR